MLLLSGKFISESVIHTKKKTFNIFLSRIIKMNQLLMSFSAYASYIHVHSYTVVVVGCVILSFLLPLNKFPELIWQNTKKKREKGK
jgi:ABC-type transport system involved in cytochrome bd biosynthesis fused ATPase/permease subunit